MGIGDANLLSAPTPYTEQTKEGLLAKEVPECPLTESILNGANAEDGGGVGPPSWTEGNANLSVQLRGCPACRQWRTEQQERCEGRGGEATTQRRYCRPQAQQGVFLLISIGEQPSLSAAWCSYGARAPGTTIYSRWVGCRARRRKGLSRWLLRLRQAGVPCTATTANLAAAGIHATIRLSHPGHHPPVSCQDLRFMWARSHWSRQGRVLNEKSTMEVHIKSSLCNVILLVPRLWN